MSHLLKLLPLDEQPRSRRMSIKGQLQSRPLSQANQEALFTLGALSQASGDPHGQCLRQSRLSQQRNPAELATQACISLAQLYALESGNTALFYTPNLALHAARRVALLLGEDWDAIVSGSGRNSASNVHTLNRVVPVQASPTITVDANEIAVPRLLTASADVQQEQPPTEQATTPLAPPEPKPTVKPAGGAPGWRWLLVIMLLTGIGTQWPVLAGWFTSLQG